MRPPVDLDTSTGANNRFWELCLQVYRPCYRHLLAKNIERLVQSGRRDEDIRSAEIGVP